MTALSLKNQSKKLYIKIAKNVKKEKTILENNNKNENEEIINISESEIGVAHPAAQDSYTDLSVIPEKKRGLFGKIIHSEYFYLSLAFALPIAIMYLIYFAMEIHPFGNGSVLVLDLNGQYVYFFEALRNWVHGDTSLLYSFFRALGGEFMGIFAYYIASPLSYILCLFPKARMLEGLLVMLLLKTGICGFTFGFYLHKTNRIKNKCAIICFSLLYALSAYCIVQQHNTMWIDCVMWLPLVTLGLESLICRGKFKMFTIFLSLSVFSNFYIGYMVCIFVAVYFFYYYFSTSENKCNNELGEKHHFVKSLGRTVGFSALACGMAMVIILTAYYSLTFGKNDFQNPSFAPTSKFDFVDLLTKFFPGSYDTVRPEGWPFVYCGVLTLFLVPIYFLSKKFSPRQKILAGAFILFFIFSFSFSISDLVWHGFQKPNWLNYRYSFMLCFFLLSLAYKSFNRLQEMKSSFYVGIATVLSGFLIIIQKLDYENMPDISAIWMSLFFIALTAILLCLLKRREYKENVTLILVIFICLETFCNGLSNCLSLHDDVYYSKYSSYNDFLSGLRPIVETVQENDTSFYRMEKTHHRKTNDNMALEIRGLSNSTSTLNAETIKFLNYMGYASKSHWSKYLGGTPVNDSLLGLKYIISKDDLSHYYKEAYKEGDYTAYYNPYALSIAYGANNAINSLDLSSYETPFEALNAMISALVGEETKVFVPVPIIQTTYTNMTETYIASHSKYAPVDKNTDANLYYSFDVPKGDTEYFFFLPSDYPREMKLKVNGTAIGTFYANETDRIVSVGKDFIEGDTLRLTLTVVKNEIYVKQHPDCLYYIDWSAFESAMSTLAKTQYNITSYTESHLKGNITTLEKNQTIMTTIPYDKGWQVIIDGEKANYYKTLDALIAFDIPTEGEHTLELKYMPKSFVIGLICTVTCIFAFTLICVWDAKRKRKTICLEKTADTNSLTDVSADDSKSIDQEE